MGQRLNIEIRNNDKRLANCYYHWSGFTLSSLYLTKQIIETLASDDSIKCNVAGAITLLRSTGAEFTVEAWEAARNAELIQEVACPECADRNNGLIAVTEEQMQETRTWEEGRIEINIESKTFRFDCAYDLHTMTDDEDIWDRVKDLFLDVEGVTNQYRIPFPCVDVFIEKVKLAQQTTKGRFSIGGCAFSSIY